MKEDARIIRTTQCSLPLPLILSVGLFQSDRFFAAPEHPEAGHGEHDHAASHRHAHDHVVADGFESLSFQSDRPFAVHKFQDFLNRLPETIYRGKGLLWIDESDKRHIFHLVAKRFSLDESQWEGPRTNKLVLIGRKLDRGQLRAQLEACLAPVPSAVSSW